MEINKKDPKYIESMVMTASPEELVLIIYEELLNALSSAVTALSNNEIQKFDDEINFSKRAIRELTISLDMEQEISKNLIAIYSYVQKLLLKAQFKKDVEKVYESINTLKPLYDGWKVAVQNIELQNKNTNASSKKVNIVAGMTYGKDDINVIANMSSGYKA